MNDCCHSGTDSHEVWCYRWPAKRPLSSNAAIETLRARLTSTGRPDGVGDVVFTRTDGKTVTFDNVRVDSVGPSAEAPGVIGVEFEDDALRIVHVPFVESWEFIY